MRKQPTDSRTVAARLSPADRRRLIRDIRDQADVRGPQIVNWIQDTVRVAGMVRGGNTDLIPVFWIRTFGVLADIADRVGKQLKVAPLANLPSATLMALKEAIDALAREFTDDELVYIQYRRHVECHPTQDGYRLVVREGVLKDSVFHRLSKQKMTVETTKEAIRRVLKPVHAAEHLIARDTATRACLLLPAIESASRAWFGPPA